jgi:hypothetical protein
MRTSFMTIESNSAIRFSIRASLGTSKWVRGIRSGMIASALLSESPAVMTNVANYEEIKVAYCRSVRRSTRLLMAFKPSMRMRSSQVSVIDRSSSNRDLVFR